ncbi:MAG: hypothetical protein NTX49_06050 [Chlamydiae bacterium]|nr:hypothetical protein [Chlamydiota bacterium]
MKRTPKSTFEKFIENKKQKKLLGKEYRELLVSELLLATIEEDHISVKKLAAEADVSPTITQNLRSRKKPT